MCGGLLGRGFAAEEGWGPHSEGLVMNGSWSLGGDVVCVMDIGGGIEGTRPRTRK